MFFYSIEPGTDQEPGQYVEKEIRNVIEKIRNREYSGIVLVNASVMKTA